MTSMQNVFWKYVENGLQLKVGGLHISCTTYIQYIDVLRLSRHVNVYTGPDLQRFECAINVTAQAN